jgi:benzil reductase ((S)-benzoin forming)
VLGIGRRSSAALDGERYAFVPCDLSDAKAAAPILASALASVAAVRPERVCLINNAATIEPAGVLGAFDAGTIERSLGLNLAAPVVLADLFCRTFDDDAIERRIVNVSSGAASHPIPGEALYCIAKAGLEMLTRMLSAEHASPRFRAITLRPGVIDTPMQRYARSQPPSRLPAVAMFRGFHDSGQLVAPDVVARKVVARLVQGDVDDARTYRYDEL